MNERGGEEEGKETAVVELEEQGALEEQGELEEQGKL